MMPKNADIATTRPNPVMGGVEYVNLTSSALVKTGERTIVGIWVSSTTGGTIKLWDNTSAATTVIVNTFAAAAATWYPLPFRFKTGLYCTIANTIDCTISFS